MRAVIEAAPGSDNSAHPADQKQFGASRADVGDAEEAHVVEAARVVDVHDRVAAKRGFRERVNEPVVLKKRGLIGVGRGGSLLWKRR
jgi:hypothetical protein